MKGNKRKKKSNILLLSYVLDVPKSKLYNALTRIKNVEKWLAKAGSLCTIKEADFTLKEGGNYRIESQDLHGRSYLYAGAIQKIGKKSISFTLATPSNLSRLYHTHISLDQKKNHTKLSITVNGLNSDNEASSLTTLWNSIVDMLYRGLTKK